MKSLITTLVGFACWGIMMFTSDEGVFIASAVLAGACFLSVLWKDA
jgi:hypothetical protein